MVLEIVLSWCLKEEKFDKQPLSSQFVGLKKQVFE